MALAVVDASVVAKWFLEEAHTAEARRLRDDFLEGTLQVRVPSLLAFEVLDALQFHPRFPRSSVAEAARDLDRAGLMAVPLIGEYLDETVRLALNRNLSIYDASYVALARILECPLYTADARVMRAAESVDRVLHIRDYRA